MELQRARQFVDRPPMTDLIAMRLMDLLLTPPVLQCILNFYGIPGVGKTALLAQTEESYAQDSRLITIGFSVEELGQDLQRAKVRFLKCFTAYASDMAHELHPALQSLGDASDEPAINSALQALVANLSRQARPLLLVLDSWEYVPEALFAWVERSLLLPLMRDTRMICVLGSQAPLRWRQFEVRRRVHAEQLQALDVAGTARQLGQPLEVAETAYEITFGHPLANETIYAELARSGAPAAELRPLLKSRRADLTDQIVRVLYHRVVGGVSSELEQIFNIIALFREFDIHTLRTVLPQFYATFKNRSDSALLLSIKQLLDTRLVRWGDESRAYQLDQTMRKIFTQALALRDPAQYEQICAVAMSYYEQLIREVPGNRNVYVVEYFFHSLYKGEPALYNKKTIEDRMRQIVRAYYYSPDGRYRDDAELKLLRDRFTSDEELQGLLRSRNLTSQLFVRLIDEALSAPLPNGSDQWKGVAALK